MTTTNAPGAGRLTPEAATRLARVSIGAVVLLAVAAATLSFEGLRTLGIEAGLHPALAVLLPLCADGLVLTAGLTVVYCTLQGLGTTYAWILVGLGTALSVTGNVVAADATVIARGVAAAPPVVFALALEQVLRVLRHRAGLPVLRRPAGRQTPTSSPAHDPHGATPPVSASSRAITAESRGPGTGSLRTRVETLLATEPDLTAPEIARRLGSGDPSSIRRYVRDHRIRAEASGPRLTLATASGGVG